MDVNCPVCGEPTRPVEIGGRRVLSCPGCGGMLIADGELPGVVESYREKLQNEPSASRSADQARRDRRLECPMCSREMIASPCEGPGRVIVDRCRSCGVSWIDPGEIEELARTDGRLPEPAPAPHDKQTEIKRGILYKAATVAILLGLVGTIYGWASYVSILNVKNRPAAPGYVSHRAIYTEHVYSGKASTEHTAVEIAYEYKVGGRSYTGHRVNPAVRYRTGMGHPPRHLFSFRDNAREMYDHYPENRRVKVLYDSENPSDAVLETYTPPEVTLGLLAGPPLLILGVVGFWRFRR